MHQPESSENAACHCTTLRKASRYLSQYYDSVLAASGIKTTQRAILAQLRREGSQSVSGLAEALVMDRGGLTHTLKPLQRDGLISLGADPDDGRSRLISLTDSGYKKLTETDAGWALAQRQVETQLGAKESMMLQALLTSVISSDFDET
ncbi:MAG: MarR family winged helix-turn-helix transcriptional regulator [Klebsiella michiganensis]|nr:MarR family winged helix-turn-helix transcriptional regulator [Klebsiella michiganensis]